MVTRKCKICGKEYEYCHSNRKQGDIFHYQDVACCFEHGREYFALVMKARMSSAESESVEDVEDVVYDDEQEDDSLEYIEDEDDDNEDDEDEDDEYFEDNGLDETEE